MQWVTAMVGALATAGCQGGSCDQALVDRAESFIKAHQGCETDADCVIISDYCETLPHGFCGQLVMSKAAKTSPDWVEINQELLDCSPSKCTVCAGAREPRCTNGSCNGP